MARLAADAAQQALRTALSGLDSRTPAVCTNTVLASTFSPDNELSVAEVFAYQFRESIELVNQAGTRMAQTGAAVSDAAYSRNTDGADAALDALAPFASRTAAAHMLLGGDFGLPAIAGVAEEGFYTRSSLSGEGQQALQWFRAAAIDPALIRADGTSAPTMDEIALGSGAVAEVDSIRYRLGVMQSRDLLRDAPSADVVYEQLGVSRSGFSEARELLREELRAFDRSPEVLVPAEPLPDGTSTADLGIDLYAATRVPVTQLPTSYWAAVLRYDPSPPKLTLGPGFGYFPPAWPLGPDGSGNLPAGDTWGTGEASLGNGYVSRGRRTVASVLDEAQRHGADVLSRLCPGGMCGAGLEDAAEVIAGAVADLAPMPDQNARKGPSYETAPYIGRARACWYDDDDFRFWPIQVHSSIPAEELLVVRGRDGLECAVRGALEGTPCTASQWASLRPTSTPWWALDPSTPEQLTSFVFNASPGDRPTADTMALFVVRRRAGFGVNDPSMPGQYEELTGFILADPGSVGFGYRYCIGSAIVPRLEREAAGLVMPSTSAPFRPAETCAGLPSNMRLPLENELTSITSGRSDIESSWFHYLELARRAAAEADSLGEDVIRTGLEMDSRAESAADDLSRLCGVDINITSIAATLEADSIARVATSGPPCALPYVQQDSQCVLDPVLYAASRAGFDDDMSRLAACIGADIVPWATLGDQALCAWDATPGVAGGICEGASETMPCPKTADSRGACPSTSFTIPAGAELIVAGTRLNLFTQPAEPVPDPPDPNDLPCSALSALRNGVPLSTEMGPEGETLDQLLTDLLQWDTLSYHARQLTWEALVGDYASVRYAGSIVFRTGSVTNPAPAQWPMGVAPEGACPTTTRTNDPLNHTGPLFCLENVGSTTRVNRARTNDLLLRAVFAARIFTGAGLQGSVVPYYSTNQAHQYETIDDTFSWSPFVGTSPRASCTQSGQLLIDHRDWDEDGPYEAELADFGSRACRIANPDPGSTGVGCLTNIPAGAEWAVCPYDFFSCAVFDDQDDCDDGVVHDRNMPLVLRAIDDDLNLANASETAANMWARDFAGALRARATAAVWEPAQELTDTSISDLTRYFLSGEGDDGRIPSRCLDEYEDCVDGLPAARLMVDGNIARVPRRLTVNDVLNGFELTCYAARQGLPPSDLSRCDAPTEINDLTDAWRMAGYMDCAANTLNGRGASSLIANLPSRVVEIMQARGGADTYGGGAGELDAEISELRAALVALGRHRINIAADLRAYASRIRSLQVSVAQNERSGEIEELMFLGRTSDRVTQCVTAILDAAAATASVEDAAGGGFRAGSAAATCVNSSVQITLDRRITDLRRANIDDSLIQEFQAFDGETAEFSRRMSERALDIRSELERFDGALARLRGNQMQARRALSRALLLDDGGMDAYMTVNRVYRARYNTLLERYLASHTRAVRAAFIARLALEQRLGMPLADISDDVFSDEAPSEWVDTICSLPSIDYDSIRGSTPGPTGERDSDTVEFAGPDDYSGAYVGDYVRRLQDVFESYNFVYPFQDGTDTAAISLRDDVFVTRAPCDIAPPNILFNGGRLDVLGGRDRLGWSVAGCDPSAATDPEDRRCVSIDRLEDTTDMPSGAADLSRTGRPIPYRLSFGGTLAATAAARVEQSITLGRGRHRLSWFARAGVVGGIDQENAVQAWDAAGTPLRTGSISDEAIEGSADWRRYWFFFDVDEEATFRVVIPFGGTPGTPRDIDLGGLMLETIETIFGSDPQAAPPPYFEPGDSGVTEVRDCLDRDGTHFRREAWTHDCVRVCNDGYDGNCPAEWSEARCYWETSFDVSSDSLQQILVSGDAGFASGNFNYRIESVGVNLIGTGLRDCEAGEGTAGCYASGNISFSMLHQGPFLVRNALGRIYDAPLFPGRIESARALAAERYLTNPLSSADRSLIEPYTRAELRGRPLGGSLTLRLWDDPRFRFDRLEDVQILLTYRYWQHQR